MVSGQVFQESEFDFVAANTFDPAEAHTEAVAEFVELACLCAQYSAQMVSGLTFHDRAIAYKLFDEESPAHARILSQVSGLPPKGKRRDENRLRRCQGHRGATDGESSPLAEDVFD